MVELGEEDEDGESIDESDHDRAGDEPHEAADAERAEGELDDAGEDRRREQVLDPVVPNEWDHHERHCAGGGRNHGRPATGEGDDDRDGEAGVETDLGIDAGDDRERDRFGDEGDGHDEAGEQIRPRVDAPAEPPGEAAPGDPSVVVQGAGGDEVVGGRGAKRHAGIAGPSERV